MVPTRHPDGTRVAARVAARVAVMFACTLAVVGCSGDAGTATEQTANVPETGDAAEATALAVTEAGSGGEEAAPTAAAAARPAGADEAVAADTGADTVALVGEPLDDAIVDAGTIPYPLYPDAERYRIGGENGLRIVLFETDDGFDEVDAWYREQEAATEMSRLAAMSDYVRYARDGDDTDAWGTHRPGIVIHGFADDEERSAVGADPRSRTNIIVSY